MEVKINREIRNYTESIFFGLSLRQSIFSFLAIAMAVILGFVVRERSTPRSSPGSACLALHPLPLWAL